MKLYILIGTRPNFIKVTRFKTIGKILNPEMEIQVIHTGQHYDEKMADVFFQQFSLHPNHFLNINPASPNRQIAEIMLKLEELCNKIGKPDLLLVPGDVNSSLAGALFANKTGIKLGHIEAGLRSFDRGMPEEFNRILTDQLSDLFFVTEPSGLEHLKKEGIPDEKVYFVGNTMIDTMVAFENEIESSTIVDKLGIQNQKFALITMHRPSNVDNREGLEKLLSLIEHLSVNYKIVFPMHPRTMQTITRFGLQSRANAITGLHCTEPLDYFAFQKLIKSCSFIITDSGGIQEESTYRQKPCITLRLNTERPVTVEVGTNTLIDFDLNLIRSHIADIENGTYKKGAIPDLWDGKATERILTILNKF